MTTDSDGNTITRKTSIGDDDKFFPHDGTDGLLREIHGDEIKDSIYNIASINAQTGTAYTLVLADAGKAVTMENGSANTLTIPANSAVAFTVGTQLTVWQKGAGTTTVTGDTGVTVNGTSAGGADIGEQYHAVALLKIATDTWFMTGDHGTVS